MTELLRHLLFHVPNYFTFLTLHQYRENAVDLSLILQVATFRFFAVQPQMWRFVLVLIRLFFVWTRTHWCAHVATSFYVVRLLRWRESTVQDDVLLPAGYTRLLTVCCAYYYYYFVFSEGRRPCFYVCFVLHARFLLNL